MQEAAQFLVGTHDFSTFRSLSSETPFQSPVRTVFQVDIQPSSGFLSHHYEHRWEPRYSAEELLCSAGALFVSKASLQHCFGNWHPVCCAFASQPCDDVSRVLLSDSLERTFISLSSTVSSGKKMSRNEGRETEQVVCTLNGRMLQTGVWNLAQSNSYEVLPEFTLILVAKDQLCQGMGFFCPPYFCPSFA